MEFPKFLIIFVPLGIVRNFTNTGEVTDVSDDSLELIKLIAKGLGCSYRVFIEGKWNGANGHFYIGGLAVTRQNYFLMSYPYTSVDMCFAIEKPPFKVKTFAALWPFSLSVWIGLLLCVILASLTHFLIFWRKISLMSTFFYIVGTLIGEYHNWRPKSMAQKMLILTWSVGIMFMTLSYGSVLLSFLTVPVREKGITNFDDLYEAVQLKQAIAVSYERDRIHDMMTKCEDTKLRFFGEHLKSQKRINHNNALQIVQKNVAIIAARASLSLQFVGDKYFISEDTIMPSYLAIFDLKFGEKPFCCMKQVNDVIHRIWAAGINKKLEDDLAFKIILYNAFNDKYPKTDQIPIRPLSLSDLSGAFYFLVIGHIIGLISFVFEILAHHCQYMQIQFKFFDR